MTRHARRRPTTTPVVGVGLSDGAAFAVIGGLAVLLALTVWALVAYLT